jgi:hypothetical protein
MVDGFMMKIIIYCLLYILASCSGGSNSQIEKDGLFLNYSNQLLLADCEVSCTKGDFETEEYYNPDYGSQNFLDAINAAAAYSYLANNNKNWAGDNVNVAVIDTGVYMHDELLRNYSLLSHYDSIQDIDGHGTHVAGIIAAAKDNYGVHGVAPNAKIVSIALKGLCSDNCEDSNPIMIEYGTYNYDNYVIENDITVVNGSFGSSASNITKYQNMVDNGASNLVQVYAAGNDSNNNPNYPAIFADDTRIKGKMLAVVAYDVNNNSLAYFTNKCDAITRCIAAPGVNILSTSKEGNYAISSGTSMATPVVSGAVAVLQAAWPHLGGRDIVDIILSTGGNIDGTNIKLLNLEEAVKPLGVQRISLNFSDQDFLYDSLALNIPNHFAAAFDSKFLAFIDRAVFFDSFKRDYKANLQNKLNFIGSKHRIGNYFTNNINTQQINLMDKKLSFDLIYKERDKLDLIHSEFETDIENIAYSFNFNDYNFSLSSATKLSKAEINNNILSSVNLISASNLSNYYNNFIAENFSLAIKWQGNYNNLFNISFNKANSQQGNNLDIMDVSYARIFKNFTFNINYNLINETGSALGFSGDQAFDLIEEAKTNFYELSLIYEVGKNKFFSKYGLLKSNPKNNKDSFMKLKGRLELQNFNFGYLRDNKSYKFGIVMSRPWFFSDAEMELTLPVGLDENNNLIQETYRSELDNINKLDFEFFLAKEVNNYSYNVNFLIKEQSNSQAQYIGLVNYKINFN